MKSDYQGPMEAAIRWHVRLRDADDHTWKAFEEWLAADPSHPAIYDEVEQLDDDLDLMLPALSITVPANDSGEGLRGSVRGTKRRWWAAAAGGSVAAAGAAFLFLSSPPDPPGIVVATTAGEQRIVRVGRDVVIALNGSTRLIISGQNDRSVELLEGQAFFRVRHDRQKPFALKIGDARITDVGTTFDVTLDPQQLRVAVGEGEVLYRTQSHSAALGAGQSLVASTDGVPKVTRAPDGSIGAWRDRQLVYSNAPLSQVATDLGRSLGLTIEAQPDLRDRPFSGSIILRGSGAAELHRLQAVLNVSFLRRGDVWMMKSGDSGER